MTNYNCVHTRKFQKAVGIGIGHDHCTHPPRSHCK